jgi:hypothetical protein
MGLYNSAAPTPRSPSSITATHYAVNAAVTSTALLAANLDRRGASLFNTSTSRLYVKLSATATTTDFTFWLEPGGYFEMPFDYVGVVSGIWTAANGNVLIAEYL